MHSLMFLAQAAAPAQAGTVSNGMGMMIPMILIFGIFYFMMIRPQQRKEKERLKMIQELRAGQKILFANGLTGTVAEVRESTFLVEIAPKVVIEIARNSVSSVLKEGEAPKMDERK